MNLDELEEESYKAIKKLITGFCLKEVVSEYVVNEDGKKVLAKQKITKKAVPPSTDILKMLYNKNNENATNFNDWTDAELEKEKQRLLKLIKKGENNEYRAN